MPTEPAKQTSSTYYLCTVYTNDSSAVLDLGERIVARKFKTLYSANAFFMSMMRKYSDKHTRWQTELSEQAQDPCTYAQSNDYIIIVNKSTI